MYKKIIYMIMSFILISFFIISPVQVVHANEYEQIIGQNYNRLSPKEKLKAWFMWLCTMGGKILSLDATSAAKYSTEFANYLTGNTYPTTAGELSLEDAETLYNDFINKFDELGNKIDESTGEITVTDDFVKEFRTWLDDYLKENEKPMYYLVEVPCVGEKTLKASYCYSTAMYETIKFFVEQFGDCYVMKYYNNLYVFPLGSSTDYDYFTTYFGDYDSATKQFYVFDSVTEKRVSTRESEKDFYIIEFKSSQTAVTDLDSNRIGKVNTKDFSMPSYTNMYYGYALDINCFSANGSNYTIDTFATIVTKEDKYIKVFTSLANYQDYKSGTYDQNVYYTTNYYKTENIQQSAIGLDEMVKLYEAYDDLCKKIIQYVKDNQDATNSMVVNKLDELISAVYATGGNSGGSTDVNVDVDMSETNNLLKKILEAIKNIRSETYIDYGDSTVNTDWANIITNMIVQPEININATVGNMAEAFTDSASMLKNKFPFSIPWDIAFLLEFLADTPATPKFEIPFTIESMEVHEKVVIDLENFEAVSKVSRMLLTMLYMISLMQLTTKMVMVGKEQ